MEILIKQIKILKNQIGEKKKKAFITLTKDDFYSYINSINDLNDYID